MADAAWLEIFASYTEAELDAHITSLKAQISVFSAQNVGEKGFTKDLRELKDQLSSAIRVKKERGLPTGPQIVVTDFRRGTWNG